MEVMYCNYCTCTAFRRMQERFSLFLQGFAQKKGFFAFFQILFAFWDSTSMQASVPNISADVFDEDAY
jgi:hypothetical protein